MEKHLAKHPLDQWKKRLAKNRVGQWEIAWPKIPRHFAKDIKSRRVEELNELRQWHHIYSFISLFTTSSNPCTRLRSPYLGKATEAAGAALPSATGVYVSFSL